MRGVVICLPVWVFFASASLGQPRAWVDDFTTVATYDSNSLYATCSNPNAPSTKYTLVEVLGSDLYNDHAVSGGGNLRLTSRHIDGMLDWRYFAALIGVIDFGQSCPDNPDPSPGAQLVTSEPFSSPDVCIYAGAMFTPWHLRYKPNTEEQDYRYGPDGQPGVAGVDDDVDGVTDEADEALALRPTPVNGGYGHAGPNGYRGGRDGSPGVAGVDDDGNGVVDDIGELGWRVQEGVPLSDDGDDGQRIMRHTIMRGNFSTTSFIYFNLDPGTPSWNQCSILEVLDGSGDPSGPARADEIVYGFYKPCVHYNYVYCNSGTCYGAALWTGTDMANPDETLGPVANTMHTGPNDNIVAFSVNSFRSLYQRQIQVRGNSNFGEALWVVSGPVASYYPSPSSDLDGDKDVDGFDFLTFSNCYNGSNKPSLAACQNTHADLDDDGDVDGFDFLTFSNCYNGSNRRPLSACFPPLLTSLNTCGS